MSKFSIPTKCLSWVKMRITHIEHMSAGLPPITDIARRGWHGSFVPIADIPRRSEKHRYSITSSARARISSGTFSPSAFATVTLTAMSNFVGCSTGRSPGFAPRRILST